MKVLSKPPNQNDLGGFDLWKNKRNVLDRRQCCHTGSYIMMEKSAFLELFDTGSLLLVRAYNTREFHDFDWVDEAVNHTVGLGLYFPQSIDKNPIANPIVSALMQLAQWRRREDRLELKHLILIEKAWEYYKNQERDGSSVAVAEPLRLSGYMKTGTQSGINRDPRG